MSSFLRFFWNSGNDNIVDPAIGLTSRQKKIVQSTWAVVRKDPVASGVAVMIAFFKKHPEYQKVFPSFKDLSIEELPNNKKFQAHCMNIITSLNNVIDSMNDPSLMEANLITIGDRHIKRGQTLEQFQHLKEVIMDVFRQKFGAKFTTETSDAWSKTLDIVVQRMMTKEST